MWVKVDIKTSAKIINLILELNTVFMYLVNLQWMFTISQQNQPIGVTLK